MTKKEPKLEASFKRLEEIVEELERGDLALEKSLKIFEEGIKLSRYCSSKLDEAEKRIEILLEGDDGKLKAVSFDERDENSEITVPSPPVEEDDDEEEEELASSPPSPQPPSPQPPDDNTEPAAEEPHIEINNANNEGKLF